MLLDPIMDQDRLDAIQDVWKTVFIGKRSNFFDLAEAKQRGVFNPVLGSTSFLRYPAFQYTLMQDLLSKPSDRPIRILVVPGSVGCEAYTLRMVEKDVREKGIVPDLRTWFSRLAQNGWKGYPNALQIDAFDLSDRYTLLAQEAAYPEQMIETLPKSMRNHFTIAARQKLAVLKDEIKTSINVLPAQSVFDFKPDAPYDVIIVKKLFIYLNMRQNEELLAKLSDIVTRYLCTDDISPTSEWLDFDPFDFEHIKKSLYDKNFHFLDKKFRPTSAEKCARYGCTSIMGKHI